MIGMIEKILKYKQTYPSCRVMIAPFLDAPLMVYFSLDKHRVVDVSKRWFWDTDARNFTFNMKDAEEGEQREPRASQTYFSTFCKQ